MIKIAICDDLKSDRDNLSNLLYKISDKLDIHFELNIFTSGAELLSSNKNFDIIFLDIVMENIDGIETLKQIRNENAIIIFMSTTSDRLRELFSKNVIAFLDKPITEQSLQDAFVKAIELISNENSFVYNKNGKVNVIRHSEIIYIECEAHYIKIHTKNDTIIYKGKIKDVFAELIGYKNFAMPNRSFIVNMQYVSLASKSAFNVDMLNQSISISRTNKDETIMRFMSYLTSKGHN